MSTGLPVCVIIYTSYSFFSHLLLQPTVSYERKKNRPDNAEYDEDEPSESSALVAHSCDDGVVTVGASGLNWHLADHRSNHSWYTHHHSALLTTRCAYIHVTYMYKSLRRTATIKLCRLNRFGFS